MSRPEFDGTELLIKVFSLNQPVASLLVLAMGAFMFKTQWACHPWRPGADKGGEGKSKWVEKYIWNEEKQRTARRAPGDQLLKEEQNFLIRHCYL